MKVDGKTVKTPSLPYRETGNSGEASAKMHSRRTACIPRYNFFYDGLYDPGEMILNIGNQSTNFKRYPTPSTHRKRSTSSTVNPLLGKIWQPVTSFGLSGRLPITQKNGEFLLRQSVSATRRKNRLLLMHLGLQTARPSQCNKCGYITLDETSGHPSL